MQKGAVKSLSVSGHGSNPSISKVNTTGLLDYDIEFQRRMIFKDL